MQGSRYYGQVKSCNPGKGGLKCYCCNPDRKDKEAFRRRFRRGKMPRERYVEAALAAAGGAEVRTDGEVPK
jgi:hypothetical protein